MRTRSNLTSLVVFGLIAGCGLTQSAKDAATSEMAALEESKPSDSTGATASVALLFASTFGTPSEGGLMLDEPVAAQDSAASGTSIEINDKFSLSYAKFNIAKIRMKAERDQKEEEKTLEKSEIADEKTAVSTLDRLVGDLSSSSTNLLDPPSGQPLPPPPPNGQRAKKEAERSKVKEKLEDLKGREKERLEKGQKQDKSTKFVGPYVYDAVLKRIEGDAPKVDLVDGSYKRVEFQMLRNFGAPEADPLLGHVFAMKGNFTKNDGQKIPVEIEWSVALNFRIAGEKGASVKTGEDNSLIVDFNIGKWFEGIDLDTALIDAEGTMYINRTNNSEIMKKLLKNMKIHSGFGKDKNKDGKLDTDERAGQGQETSDAEPSA